MYNVNTERAWTLGMCLVRQAVTCGASVRWLVVLRCVASLDEARLAAGAAGRQCAGRAEAQVVRYPSQLAAPTRQRLLLFLDV